MAELPAVAPGETIEAARTNQEGTRIISRYADASDRDATTPTPETGEPAYLLDTGVLQIWDGSAWVSYAEQTDVDARVLRAGDTMTGNLQFGPGTNRGLTFQDPATDIQLAQDGDKVRWFQGAVEIFGINAGSPTVFGSKFLNWLSGRFRVSDTGGTVLDSNDATNNHIVEAHRGFRIDTYGTQPTSGQDLYGLQARNIIASDQAPSNSVGIDGDVWIHYGPGNGRSYVRVNGTYQ